MFEYLPKDNVACFLIGGGIVLAAVLLTALCYRIDDYRQRRKIRRDYFEQEEEVYYPEDWFDVRY